MGTCFSVSVPCDQVVNQFSRCLCVRWGYIHNLPDNVVALKTAIGVLKARRDDVQRRVEREEYTGRRRRLTEIQVWLARTLRIETEAHDLLSTSSLELERLCLCGVCSKNLKLSYLFGKRVSVMLRDVERLSSQGEFDVVTQAAPLAEVEEMPIQSTIVGQETMLGRVWNRVMKDKLGIVGLHGMAGVGKTTLLTQLNNKYLEIDDPGVVIWATVSRDTDILKIQGAIAQRLGLDDEEWGKKNENQRALDIHNVLKSRKFVLLLDDIWEKVDLKAVGVPYPSREMGRVVAFTTRSHDVCGRMGVQDPIKVSCLEEYEAWDLFKKKVGETTIGSHPDIPELARTVAEKCGRLPLALNVIGETMAGESNVQEWHRAVKVLTSYASEFSGMEDEILPILKYSYDNLKSDSLKSCFLYCSLFPEDALLEKGRLIDYWMCEGFIEEYERKEGAVNQGYAILRTLVRTSLLMEGGKHDNKSYVKMHDVVREMALWVASDLGKHKGSYIVRAGVGLDQVPKVKNWKLVRRMSLVNNRIEEIHGSPECPELTTLLLQDNRHLVSISGEFLLSMPLLVVLDLSSSVKLKVLPEQISQLVSLRFLDLSESSIESLPVGLLKLKMLMHLNLESMLCLKIVSGISNLSNLTTLKLLSVKMLLTMSLLEELKRLENLEVLTIETTSSSVLEQLLCSHRLVRCLQRLSIKYLDESVRILTLPSIEDLCEVSIEGCGMKEILIESNTIMTSPYFSHLSKVLISGCNGLKDLTWLLFAPNLTQLNVWSSSQLEEIISQEKASSVGLLPFQKLEILYLWELPELKSIYWTPLPFPCLDKIIIRKDCQKLRKLPLDSQNCLAGEELVIEYGEEEWKEKVDWEDEATRLRFLPSFKLVVYEGE